MKLKVRYQLLLRSNISLVIKLDLTVLTCSSQEYRRLTSNVFSSELTRSDLNPPLLLEKELGNRKATFATIEDTGIPELRDHCTQLTRVGFENSFRYFLQQLESILSGMLPSLGTPQVIKYQHIASFRAKWESPASSNGSLYLPALASNCAMVEDPIVGLSNNVRRVSRDVIL